MGNMTLHGLDYASMIVYLAFTVGLGVYLGRNITNDKDYFLAGRKLPWWAIGMSMVVTDIGAIDVVGIAGSAYLYGIVMGNYDWIGCVPVMIIAGFIIIPYFWRSEVYTIPEFLGRRFNEGVRGVSALLWASFLACNLGLMLYATAVLMKSMMGLSFTFSVLLVAVLVSVYTLAGGLLAVVYTDVLQCVVLFLGCIVTSLIGLYNVGGFDGLFAAIHNMGPGYENHLNLVLPMDTKSPHPWPGIFFGLAMVLAPAYWFGNQAIVQRCLGASSEFEAKASFMFGALLKTILPFVIVIPGLIALATNPNLLSASGSSDNVLPDMIRDTFPRGLLGPFFAAFLASLMSGADSSLNSVATLLTKDVYERFIKPNGTREHYLNVGRIITIISMVWGVLFAFWVADKSESLYTVIQTMLSLFQGPNFAVILLGIMWWRATGIGALAGLIGGLICSIGLFTVHKLASAPVFLIDNPFNYIALWSFLAAAGITVAVSLLTPPEPQEKLAGLVYKYAVSNVEKPKHD